MDSHVLRPYPETHVARWLVVGFISGFVSVLIFHQGALALLHAAGLTKASVYSTAATHPWGVPAIWSLAFWGGVWGVLLAAALEHTSGAALIVGAVIFGAVLPTLVAWFVVAPMKGQPMAAGFVPSAMIVGPIVNAAWGLGTGIGLLLFGRSSYRRTR